MSAKWMGQSKTFRYCYAREISEVNRDRAWASGLANIGDCRLVWVNEGDLIEHGEEIEQTKLANVSSAADESRKETK